MSSSWEGGRFEQASRHLNVGMHHSSSRCQGFNKQSSNEHMHIEARGHSPHPPIGGTWSLWSISRRTQGRRQVGVAVFMLSLWRLHNFIAALPALGLPLSSCCVTWSSPVQTAGQATDTAVTVAHHCIDRPLEMDEDDEFGELFGSASAPTQPKTAAPTVNGGTCQ